MTGIAKPDLIAPGHKLASDTSVEFVSLHARS